MRRVYLEKENQIVLVKNYYRKTILQMKQKDEKNVWKTLLETSAFIGENGMGKTKEGDKKTPSGLYDLGIAFGIKENPRDNVAIHKNNKRFLLGR